MANYGTTYIPEFKPRSFQDVMAPLLMYKNSFDTLMNQYEEQQDKASLLKEAALNDPELKERYQQYADNIQESINALYEGIGPNSLQSLKNSRALYRDNIIPIAQAFENKKKAQAMYDELKLKDPSLLGSNPYNVELNKFIEGRDPGMYNVSGNELSNTALAMTQGVVNSLYNEKAPKVMFGGQYYDIESIKGIIQDGNLSIDELIQKYPILNEIATEVYNSYNGDALGEDSDRAKEFIKNGMIKGLAGQVHHDRINNTDHITPLQNAQLSLSKNQFEFEKAKYNATHGGGEQSEGNPAKNFKTHTPVNLDALKKIKGTPTTSIGKAYNLLLDEMSNLQSKGVREEKRRILSKQYREQINTQLKHVRNQPQFKDVPLPDLKENSTIEDVNYLLNAIAPSINFKGKPMITHTYSLSLTDNQKAFDALFDYRTEQDLNLTNMRGKTESNILPTAKEYGLHLNENGEVVFVDKSSGKEKYKMDLGRSDLFKDLVLPLRNMVKMREELGTGVRVNEYYQQDSDGIPVTDAIDAYMTYVMQPTFMTLVNYRGRVQSTSSDKDYSD